MVGSQEGEIHDMPYEVTRRFERALCAYTGAPYAVAVNSGTAALTLCVERYCRHNLGVPPILRNRIEDEDLYRPQFQIPKHTYVSVPQAIIRGGGSVLFTDTMWKGSYEVGPITRIWDSACRFTSGMYVAGHFQCVSFAARKILGAEQGGAILHDNADADKWFRKMRLDGRTEGLVADDNIDVIGHHCIMIPSVAATLLLRLHHLPKHNQDLSGAADYPDISKHPAFK